MKVTFNLANAQTDKSAEFIKEQALRLATNLFGETFGDDAVKMFADPLAACYQRGLDDSMILIAVKFKQLINIGLKGVETFDHRLEWEPKKDQSLSD